MADREIERKSLWGTSEATPPRIDDSPKKVCQPSTPEEQRVTSSTDPKLPEVADYPKKRRIRPTSDPNPANDAKPSSSLLKLYLETNEAEAVENGSPSSIPNERFDTMKILEDNPEPEPDTTPYPAFRRIIEAQPDTTTYPLLRQIFEAQPLIIHSDAQRAAIQAALHRAAVGSEFVHVIQEPAQVLNAVEDGLIGFSQTMTKDAIKKNIDSKSDDSNLQSEAEDLSPVTKSNSKNFNFGKSLSENGFGCSCTRQREESALTKVAGEENHLYPRTDAETSEVNSSRTIVSLEILPQETNHGTKNCAFCVKRKWSATERQQDT